MLSANLHFIFLKSSIWHLNAMADSFINVCVSVCVCVCACVLMCVCTCCVQFSVRAVLRVIIYLPLVVCVRRVYGYKRLCIKTSYIHLLCKHIDDKTTILAIVEHCHTQDSMSMCHVVQLTA